MTYRELKKQLEYMSEAKLDLDITVVLLDSTEIIPVVDHILNWESPDWELRRLGDGEKYTDHEYAAGINIVDGGLDEDHPYFTIAY